MKTDDVLDALVAVYGRPRMDRLYGDAKPEVVRRQWEKALFPLSHGQIEWALAHLPMEHVPNVLEFAAIARQMPAPVRPVGPSEPLPPADPDRVAAVTSWHPPQREPHQWAHDLRERELAGERLTPAIRAMWRYVLGDH